MILIYIGKAQHCCFGLKSRILLNNAIGGLFDNLNNGFAAANFMQTGVSLHGNSWFPAEQRRRTATPYTCTQSFLRTPCAYNMAVRSLWRTAKFAAASAFGFA